MSDNTFGENLRQRIEDEHQVFNRLWQKSQSDLSCLGSRIDQIKNKTESQSKILEERVRRLETTIEVHNDKLQKIAEQLAVNETISKRFESDLSRLETVTTRLEESGNKRGDIISRWGGAITIIGAMFAMFGAPMLIEAMKAGGAG